MRNAFKLCVMALLLMPAAAIAADTYTSNYNFRLPDLDIEDEETPWGTKYNNNFSLVDAAIKNTYDAIAIATAPLFPISGGTITGPVVIQSSITFSTGSIENVNYVQLNTGFEDGVSEGRLQWNSDDGTPEIGLPGGNVNLQVGQENLIRVKAGEDIGNGQVVYISSATGQRPVVYLADVDAVDPLARCPIGLATEDIAENQSGYITTFGLVRSTNTTGYIEGAAFYASTTKGNWTPNIYASPTRVVPMGVVIYTHATEGIVLVNPRVVPQQIVVSSLTATQVFTSSINIMGSGFPGIIIAPLIDDTTIYASEAGIAIGQMAFGNHITGIGIGYTANNNFDNGVGIGNGAKKNYVYGVGVGFQAYDNHDQGTGVGFNARANYTYGVGIGALAYDNYTYGVGIGKDARRNYNYGVGIGAGALENNDYAVGVGANSANNRGYGSALGAYSYAASSAAALGAYAKAYAYNSVAIGYGTVNNSTGTATFGSYAVATSSHVTIGGNLTVTGTADIGLGYEIVSLDVSAAGYGVAACSAGKKAVFCGCTGTDGMQAAYISTNTVAGVGVIGAAATSFTNANSCSGCQYTPGTRTLQALCAGVK